VQDWECIPFHTWCVWCIVYLCCSPKLLNKNKWDILRFMVYRWNWMHLKIERRDTRSLENFAIEMSQSRRVKFAKARVEFATALIIETFFCMKSCKAISVTVHSMWKEIHDTIMSHTFVSLLFQISPSPFYVIQM